MRKAIIWLSIIADIIQIVMFIFWVHELLTPYMPELLAMMPMAIP